jgi:hypothetical protein
MAKEQELATKNAAEVATFEALIPTAELQEQIAREMDGLKMPPPARIKVPAGGGVAFERSPASGGRRLTEGAHQGSWTFRGCHVAEGERD